MNPGLWVIDGFDEIPLEFFPSSPELSFAFSLPWDVTVGLKISLGFIVTLLLGSAGRATESLLFGMISG